MLWDGNSQVYAGVETLLLVSRAGGPQLTLSPPPATGSQWHQASACTKHPPGLKITTAPRIIIFCQDCAACHASNLALPQPLQERRFLPTSTVLHDRHIARWHLERRGKRRGIAPDNPARWHPCA